MRYLKTYKIFETIGYSDLTDDIWEDIKDILVELHDDGFFISQDIFDVKKVGNKLCEDVIEIIIDKESKEGFSFKEIEEHTRRLIDYMSDWKWSLFYLDKYDYVEFESSDVLKNNLSTEAERMLYKSLVDKNIQNCITFKIIFYKNISRVIKEKKEDIDNLLQYLKHDLEDDGLAIRSGNMESFINLKYENMKPQESVGNRFREVKLLYGNDDAIFFELICNTHNQRGSKYSQGFNLYDAEPHIKRLIDYCKSIGYNHVEVRKVLQMSRRSIDVTQSFTGKGRLPESAKREIFMLQILMLKK
jgi:hypothetical protein